MRTKKTEKIAYIRIGRETLAGVVLSENKTQVRLNIRGRVFAARRSSVMFPLRGVN